MIGLPASHAYPATCLSCSRIPASPSITNNATSQRSIAVIALNTEYFSTDSYTLPRLRIPAVSTMTYGLPSYTNGVSTASRVVPCTLETMERFSFRIAFTSDDLPTFGSPITAI